MRSRTTWTLTLSTGVMVAAVLSGTGCRKTPAHESAPASSASAVTTPESVRGALATLSSAKAGEAPRLFNMAAYLPAQCYATTKDAAGGKNARAHNACFACHQTSLAPNYANDEDVQTTLSIARYAADNRWTHLSSPPQPITATDDEILSRIRKSNYFDDKGQIAAVPDKSWDVDGDGTFGGFTPDCWFHLDAKGFDHAPDGKASGWRAFAYAPFPGMFWPTNGSAGDVFIRLPAAYRQDKAGQDSSKIYEINFAILESTIRRVDVPLSEPADERELGSDLDGDGAMGIAKRVAFVWPPKDGRVFGYVGAASALDTKKEGWPAAGLFPRGTEFLHTLRYLDVDDGHVRMSARMKEVRYMRKTRWLTYSDLQLAFEAEAREKGKSPNRLKAIIADPERGASTGTGWLISGLIENAEGKLRPQTVEETAACIGCHGGVGVTTDSTFAFARKIPSGAAYAFRDGWYHWSERGLEGIPEPKRADGKGEYARWLEAVGGGNDFRANDEVQTRFFGANGKPKPEALAALSRDIATLLVPSAKRALELDRAYLALVAEQHFERGRDVMVGSTPKFEKHLEQETPTGIAEPIGPAWLARADQAK
ncbi:hypothetical protein AKJ09_07723 [Labilithrix luteola]|uniref:Lipoprotein n=1 Tax=Labilithrix luteola TaxID=1391654 RepID=A0A0K1Q6M1_9BACT|nr:hypothetical protein [Labilithrix luteola]AKV01060.1 hypothetical protein AKJ09_07723 [Labilithrix luteola]